MKYDIIVTNKESGNMNKKIVMFCLTAFCVLGLCACSPAPTPNSQDQLNQQISDLQQTIKELQQEVNDLKNGQEAGGQTDGGQNPAGVKTPNGTEQENEQVASLRDKVNALEQKISDSKVENDYQAKVEQYFALKAEIRTLNLELDLYDDVLKQDYLTEVLTREAYQKQEVALDRLEEQLDKAEDRLEIKFGIDD